VKLSRETTIFPPIPSKLNIFNPVTPIPFVLGKEKLVTILSG
jgi:hypothetical protein